MPAASPVTPPPKTRTSPATVSLSDEAVRMAASSSVCYGV